MNPYYEQAQFWATEPVGGWPDQFAIITAYNPMDENPGEGANRAADEELRQLLEEQECFFFRVTGGSSDGAHLEPGYGAQVSLERAKEIGRRFDQRAVFWAEGDNFWLVSCDEESQEPPQLLGSWRARILGATEQLR